MICFYIEGKLKVNEELFREKLNRWQVSSGTGGRFEPESVATFTGMGGRFQPEYAPVLNEKAKSWIKWLIQFKRSTMSFT